MNENILPSRSTRSSLPAGRRRQGAVERGCAAVLLCLLLSLSARPALASMRAAIPVTDFVREGALVVTVDCVSVQTRQRWLVATFELPDPDEDLDGEHNDATLRVRAVLAPSSRSNASDASKPVAMGQLLVARYVRYEGTSADWGHPFAVGGRYVAVLVSRADRWRLAYPVALTVSPIGAPLAAPPAEAAVPWIYVSDYGFAGVRFPASIPITWASADFGHPRLRRDGRLSRYTAWIPLTGLQRAVAAAVQQRGPREPRPAPTVAEVLARRRPPQPPRPDLLMIATVGAARCRTTHASACVATALLCVAYAGLPAAAM